MATESSGDETGDETDGPIGSRNETGDKTATTVGDERDGGDRWANVCRRRSVYNRRSPSVWRALRNFAMADFEENVEEMVGTNREAADGDRVRWRRDGDETGSPGYETGNKTAATAGDEREGGDRWGNVYGRRGVRI